MHVTLHNGIRFYEGRPKEYDELAPISIELGGVIQQSQLKTLKDVKTEMAKRVQQAGGNAVIDFKYGQQSVGWFRSILQLDDVNWYGNGVVAIVHSES